MSKPRCSECIFYEPDEDIEDGYQGSCRRYPPVISDPENCHTPDGWSTPMVYSSAWCGEFQPVEVNAIEQLSKGRK